MLDFSASINPLGPPTSAIAALEASYHRLRDYPDPDYSSLRQYLAAEHHIDPTWVLPGNGSAELLTWAARDLAQLKATLLITPAFGDYYRAIQAFSGSILPCPFNLNQSDRPLTAEADLTDLIQSILKAQTTNSLGLLLNNPHNPTGQLFRVEWLRQWLEKFALIVVDEAFMDFLPPAEQQSLVHLVPTYPNLVILRSLTKFYSLPGLRLGYAIAQPEQLKRWQKWRDPWPVNVLAEAAAIAVLGDRQFQQQTWSWLPSARRQLFQGLQRLPGLVPLPGAANFLLVRCDPPPSGTQRSVRTLQEALLKQDQILIRDCLSFPELGDQYFRVAVRTAAENQRLLGALAQLL